MHKNVRLIYLFNFLTDFRFGAPIAVLYFYQVTGSYALAMSVLSVIYISQSLLEIPTGIFSDVIGRRKTLICGACASAFGMLFYALGGGFWVLAIGAALEGLSRAFYSGTENALLYESLKETGHERRFHDMLGKTGSMFQAALAISAVIGAFLADHVSYEFVFWLSVIPQLLCIVVTFLFREPKVHQDDAPQSFLQTFFNALSQFRAKPRLRAISLATILDYGFGCAGHEFKAAFFKLVIPVWVIGIVRALENGFAFISFWFAGPVIDRLSHKKALIFGSGVSCVLTAVALAVQSVFSPFIIALTSLTYGTGLTASKDMMNRDFTEQERVTMGSIVSFAGSIFYAVAAFILGWVADVQNPVTALWIVVLATCTTTGLYLYAFRLKSVAEEKP